MQIIAAIGGLSFVVASLVTGARLLLVARRTRQLPELALGLGLFLMGGLGYPLTMLGELGTFLPEWARAAFVSGNTLTGVVGLSLFAFFTARVFRPGSDVARGAVWLITALFCGSFLHRLLTIGFVPISLGGEQPPLLHSATTIVALGWAGIESLIYYAQLRKRVRLGLADPMLVNRIWLWAQGMLCAMTLTAAATALSLAGIPFNQSTVGILTIGIVGTICAASIWFAFFPPASYVRWIRSRSGADPAAAPEGA